MGDTVLILGVCGAVPRLGHEAEGAFVSVSSWGQKHAWLGLVWLGGVTSGWVSAAGLA